MATRKRDVMTGKTYKARAVVLRKTKLGEKDLIVTLLDESGQLLRAVAKGARKPGGSFAAKMELFSVVDVLLAEGRNLDVVAEARFASGRTPLQFDIDQGACAAVVAELVATVALEGLPHPRLFSMTEAALSQIAAASPENALAITAADLLKTLALVGFKPSFQQCVVCGDEVDLAGDARSFKLSIADGGVVCGACQAPADAILVDANTLRWSETLLRATFAEVTELAIQPSTSFSLLELDQQWIQVHAGRRLKSLDFLFTSGLF